MDKHRDVTCGAIAGSPPRAVALCRMLLFVAAIAVGLPACQSRSDGPVHVQYVVIWADSLNKTFEQIGREWARARHDSVVFTPVELKDLPLRVANFIEVPHTADVAVVPSTNAVIHAEVLDDLSDIVQSVTDGGHAPYPIARAMNFADSEWAGVPLYSWSHIWVWRGDLLRQKSLDYPMTLDRAPAVLEQLADTSRNRYAFGIGLNGDDDQKMFTQSILWSFGGAVFDSAGMVVLDSEPTRAALAYLVGLHSRRLLPPTASGWDGASNNRAFLDGAIAVTANSPTILYALKRENPQLAREVVHTLYPEGPRGRHTFATGFSFAVRRDNAKKDRVHDLISYYLRPDNYRRLLLAAEGSVNPQYAGYDTLSVWKNEQLRVALQSLQFEHPVGWPGPVTAAAAEVYERKVLTDMVARVIINGFSIDAAVKEAARRAEEIAERNQNRD